MTETSRPGFAPHDIAGYMARRHLYHLLGARGKSAGGRGRGIVVEIKTCRVSRIRRYGESLRNEELGRVDRSRAALFFHGLRAPIRWRLS